MSGQTIVLRPQTRDTALNLVRGAPMGHIVTVKAPRRTDAQNDKMWAMLSDVCRAAPEDRRWTTEVWKCAFMHFLGHEVLWQPGLNGEPFPLGYRSSKLSKGQMSDLITTIYAYGDEHQVRWTEPMPEYMRAGE